MDLVDISDYKIVIWTDLQRNPGCTVEWDAPSGPGGGIRGIGDPSNVRVSITAKEFASQSVTVVNRHSATGFENIGSVSLDSEGAFSHKDSTPIRADFPLGEWKTIVRWPDGTETICGGFLLQETRTQKRAGLLEDLLDKRNIPFLIAGILFLIFFRD